MKTVTPVILCVDDEPLNLRLLERTLGPSGYLVIKASDGREALDIIASRKIDLVLTDVKMPGIDGFESRYPVFWRENDTLGVNPDRLTEVFARLRSHLSRRIYNDYQFKGNKY